MLAISVKAGSPSNLSLVSLAVSPVHVPLGTGAAAFRTAAATMPLATSCRERHELSSTSITTPQRKLPRTGARTNANSDANSRQRRAPRTHFDRISCRSCGGTHREPLGDTRGHFQPSSSPQVLEHALQRALGREVERQRNRTGITQRNGTLRGRNATRTGRPTGKTDRSVLERLRAFGLGGCPRPATGQGGMEMPGSRTTLNNFHRLLPGYAYAPSAVPHVFRISRGTVTTRGHNLVHALNCD